MRAPGIAGWGHRLVRIPICLAAFRDDPVAVQTRIDARRAFPSRRIQSGTQTGSGGPARARPHRSYRAAPARVDRACARPSSSDGSAARRGAGGSASGWRTADSAITLFMRAPKGACARLTTAFLPASYGVKVEVELSSDEPPERASSAVAGAAGEGRKTF